MNQFLCRGTVTHARHRPATHSFRYPMVFVVLGLERIDSHKAALFGWNRWRLLSLRAAEYLRGFGDGPNLHARALRAVRTLGCGDEIESVSLVTMPRLLGYAFNPVNFYVCRNQEQRPMFLLAEVNNTFGASHVYGVTLETSADGHARGRAAKAFHVSPFNDMKGEYDFVVQTSGESTRIDVNLLRDGELIVTTSIEGKHQPLTSACIARVVLGLPLAIIMTMPRILREAATLYLQKKLPVHQNPIISSPDTILVSGPTLLQRIALAACRKVLTQLKVGTLTVRMPDGRTEEFGGSLPGRRANMRILSYRFFTRCAFAADVGLGESFTAGEWTTTDLTELLSLFVDNQNHFNERSTWLSLAGRLANAVTHRKRANTVRNSKNNISLHYDLGNEFFQTFLDPSMTYSCAFYTQPYESLEQAQQNKIMRLVQSSGVRPGEHVLEIGTGWGSLAMEMVRRIGCRVTTITLSERQHELATQRIASAGLSDSIDVKLCDYRNVAGTYDRIVSCEMLEAVGHDHLPTFFRTLEKLLKPHGTAAIQVITMPDQRYDAYCRNVDWIQKHVFPGGHLPSLGAIVETLKRNTDFIVERLEDIGVHYTRTLREWRLRFEENSDVLLQQGFTEEFLRSWSYYFSYCESGFAARSLHVMQFVLARPENAVSLSRTKELS